MTEYLLVSTTTASEQQAQQIATALVEQRLAACVQIVPQVRSVYRWEGKVEQAGEWLCLAKTRRSLLPQVETEILRQHDYECPELVAVSIEASSSGYMKWLDEQLAT